MNNNIKLSGIITEISGNGIHDPEYSIEKTNFYKEILSENKFAELFNHRINPKGYAVVMESESGILYFAGIEVEADVEGYQSLDLDYDVVNTSSKKGGISRLLFDQLEDEFMVDNSSFKGAFIEELVSGTPMDASVNLIAINVKER